MGKTEEATEDGTIKEPPEDAPYLFCDNCGAYSLEPVHGHYVCSECQWQSKCCEGTPQEL